MSASPATTIGRARPPSARPSASSPATTARPRCTVTSPRSSPTPRGTGAGRALKLHQRDWAAANGLDWIVWTFDPLVRRNAWFNLSVLGAHVREYLPSFYGTMSDAINAGDESDRLLVTWDVHGALPARDPASGVAVSAAPPAGALLVPTPEDVVSLRRTDPVAVTRWRADTRRALMAALDDGRPIVGFTADGNYVIGSKP